MTRHASLISRSIRKGWRSKTIQLENTYSNIRNTYKSDNFSKYSRLSVIVRAFSKGRSFGFDVSRVPSSGTIKADPFSFQLTQRRTRVCFVSKEKPRKDRNTRPLHGSSQWIVAICFCVYRKDLTCVYALFVPEMSCCSLAAGSCRNVCSKVPPFLSVFYYALAILKKRTR